MKLAQRFWTGLYWLRYGYVRDREGHQRLEIEGFRGTGGRDPKSRAAQESMATATATAKAMVFHVWNTTFCLVITHCKSLQVNKWNGYAFNFRTRFFCTSNCKSFLVCPGEVSLHGIAGTFYIVAGDLVVWCVFGWRKMALTAASWYSHSQLAAAEGTGGTGAPDWVSDRCEWVDGRQRWFKSKYLSYLDYIMFMWYTGIDW